MIYSFAGCELDADCHVLRVDGCIRPVEPQVFALLVLLLRRAGELVTREEMVEAIWDGRIVSEAAIDARVAAARRAVGDDGRSQRIIRTLPRRGLRMVAPVNAASGAGILKAPGANRPSVAVLAFRALDGERLSEAFAEGLVEDTIIEMSRTADLFVVARQSSIQLDPASSPAEVGQALGVRFMLAGSVRTAGERLRVTAHLIRCETGQEIWADRFDRTIAEVFDVETEIARIVTATVLGRIVAVDAPPSGAPPGRDLEAYGHVLAGIRTLHRYTRPDMEAARESFRAAIALEPNYARAHGLLALTEVYVPWYFDLVDDLSAAIGPAERALALDERDTRGHGALGIIRMLQRDHDRAAQHFETALKVNPNDDLMQLEYGRFLMYDGRPEEGLGHVGEAMRLNPFHPNWYWNILGRCHHTLGDCEAALAAFRKLTNPPFWTLAYMAACEAMAGRPEAAAALRARLLASRPDFDLGRFRGIFPYRDPALAERFFEGFRAAGLDMPRAGSP